MSQSPGMRVEYASDRSLLLVFDQRISLVAHGEVLRLTGLLRGVGG